MLTSKANRPKETLLQRLRHTSREPMFRAQGGVPHTIHVHIVMVFDPTLIPNDLAQIYIYIYIYIIYIYIYKAAYCFLVSFDGPIPYYV